MYRTPSGGACGDRDQSNRLGGAGSHFSLGPAQDELVEHDAGVHEDAVGDEHTKGSVGLVSSLRAGFFEDLQSAGIPDWQTKNAPGGIRTPAHTDSKSAALSTELQAHT